jgi:hypothetical protein
MTLVKAVSVKGFVDFSLSIRCVTENELMGAIDSQLVEHTVGSNLLVKSCFLHMTCPTHF